MAGTRHASRCSCPAFSVTLPGLPQAGVSWALPLCVLCLLSLLALPKDTKEHQALGALMTAHCHWWTRTLVSTSWGGGH